jgi:hypothetical protein
LALTAYQRDGGKASLASASLQAAAKRDLSGSSGRRGPQRIGSAGSGGGGSAGRYGSGQLASIGSG